MLAFWGPELASKKYVQLARGPDPPLLKNDYFLGVFGINRLFQENGSEWKIAV